MNNIPISGDSFTLVQQAKTLDKNTIFCEHGAIIKYRSNNVGENLKFSLVMDVVRNSQLANYESYKFEIFCNSIKIYSKKINTDSNRINLELYTGSDLYFYFEIYPSDEFQINPLDSEVNFGIYLKPLMEKLNSLTENERNYINSSHDSINNIGLSGIYLKNLSVSKLQYDILNALSDKRPFSCV
jgi:hypothetical protein